MQLYISALHVDKFQFANLGGEIVEPTCPADGVEDILANWHTVVAYVLYDNDAYVRFDTLDKHLQENTNWHAQRIAPTLGLPHWEALAETTAALDAFWAEIEETTEP